MNQAKIQSLNKNANGTYTIQLAKPSSKWQGIDVQVKNSSLAFTPSLELLPSEKGAFARKSESVIVNPSSPSNLSISDLRIFHPIQVSHWIIFVIATMGIGAVAWSFGYMLKRLDSQVLLRHSMSFTFLGACFLLSWLGTNQLIREFDFKWDRSELGAKIDTAITVDNSFVPDSIFVGSSKTFRNVNPIVFDSVLSEHGCELCSYNFGQAGSRATEIPYILNRIFQKDVDQNIKFVFVQLERLGWEYQDINLNAKKIVRSHKLGTLSIISKHYWRDESLPLPAKIALVYRRAATFLRHQTNFGFGSDFVNRWLAHSWQIANFKKRASNMEAGHLAFENESPKGYAKRHRDFKSMIEQKATDRYLPTIRQNGKVYCHPKSEIAVQLIRKIIDQIEAHGATPVFVEPPPIQNGSVLFAYEQGIIKNLIQLNDFSKHPEMFEHEFYFDKMHLNESGSTQFSTELATQFSEFFGKRLAAKPDDAGVEQR